MKGLDVRACRPDETKTWAEFLDRNFGYQAPQSYAVDFAPLFEGTALERSRLIFKDGRIVASATLYPLEIVIGARRFRLGVVGAVATAEDQRGQGLSARVLIELEFQAKSLGLEGLVLWSDQASFYGKAGYAPVGRQCVFELGGLPEPKSMPTGTPAYGWDWAQTRTIYEKHPMRVARTDAHWKALESITSCTRVQWLDKNGRMLAYLGFDRGRDLTGIIHEWGGSTQALHCLLWTVLKNRPNLLWLTRPGLDDEIAPQLGDVAPVMDTTLALFKSLSPRVALGDLDNIWFWGLDSL